MVGPVVPLGTLPKFSLFPLKNKEWLAQFVSSVVMFWLKNQVIANSTGSIYQIRTYSQGFRDKIAKFSQLHYLAISSRDLSTRKPNQIFK